MKGLGELRVESLENHEMEAALQVGESDKELLAAFVADDPSAFDRIVAAHHQRVARLAQRLLGWRGDVDDVVQDVFLAALKQLHRFRSEASLATWLTTITLNTCRSYRRKRVVRLRWWQSQRNARERSESTPSKDEVGEQVRRAVQALGVRDREVIVLFYLEEQSSAQIAKLLGVTENAVDIRLHRARQSLRPMLKEFVED